VQQIFEPFHPPLLKEHLAPGTADSGSLRIDHWYLNPNGCHEDWDPFLRDTLNGRIRNLWTDVDRTSFLPSHFLIKTIRAQFMIGYIVRTFGIRTALIVRNPVDVVASRLALGWGATLDDLLAQPDLIEDYLEPWEARLRSETSLVGRHAAHLAAEMMVAADQLRGLPHHFCTYEAIRADPAVELTVLASELALDASKAAAMDVSKPSRMSRDKSKLATATTGSPRREGTLSRDEIHEIRDWMDQLGVDWYGESPLAHPQSGHVPDRS